ncbi:hypothetical protein H6P81_016552 [Aristolochia fimbriata]|uniref:UspA domain-containing protein n=1 Tax=Aristolochia fimbriata TaxID=158543 RepID=A0AAV7ECF7_ARIFI|nr:hypothetical protein H6P81_016552 [Aristolochia fimbriata]
MVGKSHKKNHGPWPHQQTVTCVIHSCNCRHACVLRVSLILKGGHANPPSTTIELTKTRPLLLRRHAAPHRATAAEVDETKMKALVAIDDSDGSLYALQWALDNIFQTDEGAESSSSSLSQSGTLLLLHVQQPFQHYIYPVGPVVYATPVMVDLARKSMEENSARVIARGLESVQRRSIGLQVKVEPLIVTGDPKEMICEVAEKIHPDVVVVGSRGLTKIKRAFLGSTSDYCAHHAPCPVLIVKPPK